MSRYSKFLTALTAAATVAASLAAGGITPAEAVAILASFLGAFGVVIVPNAEQSD